ncbi:oligoendopeptidase F [Desulfitobacterium chlororespirans]|uniref:Oligopeptidase F n=1 Tax=Desulfitobacterium chlororespirans DSM 11544 TaxID=1121395 RepID=A0A1M7UH92_9FIRM|nr:oligoendopeptidase F [Desulfitobacterium chlororespirans]SHN82275.1 oligopeptidase F. Metallo peptidase. MEROPS family M03B [Desulfitobacterium chlororespirans DSM 11544]
MEQAKLKTRSEISEQYKWHLEDIFPSDQAWEEEFLKAEKLLQRAESFQGHLGDSAEALLTCFDWMDEVGQSVGEIYTYARMRRDEDNRNAYYQALTDRAGALSVRVGSALAFIVPEILALPEGRLREFRKANEKMALYDHALEDILRKREHVLSSQEEKLLAEMGEIAEGPSTIFGMANNADLKFPSIKNEQDEEVELTKGNYIQFMESEDRRVRQEAFETLYGTYQKQINTWAAILNSNIKGDVFFAKARRYPSAIEASLDDDKVPLGVYDALIDTVREFLPEMHRYVKLRKKALGLDELHMYDIYVPIVSEVKMTIPYQEAVAMCREGLKPLGSDYGKVLEEGFTSHWIDVYENQGKTSGAYSWGTYRSHPYVLLNHQDTLDSMFTIAHEMGHSLHTYFSNRTQPHIYAGYKIFVAEVASTLNEALVMDHLLKTTEDPKLLAYLLNHYLEQFRGTVFRQTMFAEFEKKTHALVEQGEALTAELLSSTYLKLNEDYYGPDVVMDPQIAIEWARIPHFYNAFYVYKYATGFSAATALARKILDEGEPAVERYLEFLSSGSSDYPIELLRKAGVDMETPVPVREALQVFTSLLDRLEGLL